MRDHDYVALQKAAQSGDLATVNEALGIELTRETLATLMHLANETRDGRTTLAFIFSVIARASREPSGLAHERFDIASRFTHVLAVFWDQRVTVGVRFVWNHKTLGAVWPELTGWKTKLELNRALAEAWARDFKQDGRIECACRSRLASVAAANPGEENALLAAMVAAPHDDAPRLVYADWLLERGDVRGEFIRLQIEAERSTTPDPARSSRLASMLSSSWRNFAGELAPYVSSKDLIHRGLVETVEMTVPAFAKHGEQVFSRWPVTTLHLKDPHFTAAKLMELGATPALDRVRKLTLAQVGPMARRRPLAALGKARHLASLHTLLLTNCGLNAKDWMKLFTELDAPKLDTVDLTSNRSHPAIFTSLARNEKLPALRCLEEGSSTVLGKVKPSEWRAAFEALAAKGTLEEIHLSGCQHLDDEIVAPLFGKKARARLTAITLIDANVTDALLVLLGKAPQLESIVLHQGTFSLAAVVKLLELPSLHTLAVTGGYGPDGWKKDEIAALLAAMEALPPSHSLKTIALPGRTALSSHPRFTILH